ncbi:hypothetical protein IscW_ISCW004751 [Ixodes scapularis]|uniref:Secreted protein n=1 Tax=Ixodes scapularis TaxID=6945 RepID=B7PHA3_IXOSC|nr:hypothetical protein IscW_ISCW004751 [Ixodes scapularis]|eukprot:XP_002402399.1 hypothetical protein IscW_ISCW004751 [Ixodes scapularis]
MGVVRLFFFFLYYFVLRKKNKETISFWHRLSPHIGGHGTNFQFGKLGLCRYQRHTSGHFLKVIHNCRWTFLHHLSTIGIHRRIASDSTQQPGRRRKACQYSGSVQRNNVNIPTNASSSRNAPTWPVKVRR